MEGRACVVNAVANSQAIHREAAVYGMKRLLIATAIAGIGILPFLSLSLAQSWPQRTVRMIVPFPPGSSPDIAARVFAERLAATRVRFGRDPLVAEVLEFIDGESHRGLIRAE